MEGIHALNPEVTGHSDEFTNRVYVSVRTRLESDGALLHPSKIRLMRRLIRDKLYRGRSISETMDFFRSVERGLEQVSGTYGDYEHYADIEQFLRKLQPMDREVVPENSLVREFIG